MQNEEDRVAEKFKSLCDLMDEQQRRLWAATEARALGYGGVSIVARATGLTRPTITTGLKELDEQQEDVLPARRIRRVGAGRPRVTHVNKKLQSALEEGSLCVSAA